MAAVGVATRGDAHADPPHDGDQSNAADQSTSGMASLRIPGYRRLWFSGLLTFGAVPMQGLARAFLAFELTGRNSALGLVLFGLGVPMLLVTPFGGVAADRFAKRTVLVVATMVLLAPAVAITVFLYLDRLQFWMLVAASVLQGASFAVMAPTRMAFSASLVGRDLLQNAIILAQLSSNATRVIGPALAGAMLGVTFLGARAVYVVAVVLFTIGLLITMTLPPGEPTEQTGPQRSPFADIAAGVRYVRSDRAVLWPTLMSGAVIGIAFPYVAFHPSLVDDVYQVGPSWLGWLSAGSAVGAVIVSVILAQRDSKSLDDRTVTVAALLFSATVIALGLTPNVWWGLLAIICAGGANAGFQVLNNSLVLMRSEEEYHGRVQSLLMLGFSAFGMFALPLGALADAVGLRQTLVAMGVTAALLIGLIHTRIAAETS